MKITIIGDLHAGTEGKSFRPVERIIKRESPDYILCTGDLELYQGFSVPFYFIHGNHEDFDQLEKIDSGKTSYRNLHHIRSGEVIQLGDLKVSGLSGNYSPQRFEWSRDRLQQDRRRHFVKSEVKKCLPLKDIHLFLSHEAPSGIGVTARGEEAGVSYVREIIEKLRPGYSFFGHFHRYHPAQIANTLVYGLPRPEDGYGVLETEVGQDFTFQFIPLPGK